MDKERIFLTYNVFNCLYCYKDILKQLENSVVMSIEVDSGCNTYCDTYCDTYGDYVSHKMEKPVYFTDVTAYVSMESEWKFTNDSRRKIIRDIKKLQLMKN